MAAPKPEHLLEQAERLIAAPSHGPPRQADLRRAISTSYYALFHLIMAAAADQIVGAVHRTTGLYGLVYRSIDHRTIATLCADLQKTSPPSRYAAYVPPGTFQADLVRFAGAVRELQQRRHKADYDPSPRFKSLDAAIAIELAREAIGLFRRLSDLERRAFLTLLVCPPR